MTTPLPPSTDYTSAANQLAKKTFMAAVRTYLNDLLGAAGHGFDAALVAAPRRITVAGTADAMTATLAPAITAYTTGMRVTALLPGANTVTGPTLNLNGLGNKTVKKKSGTGAKVALVAGDYNATLPFELEYDGTDFILLNPLVSARADIASAGTLDLSATSGALRITGTTTVTAVTLASGQIRWATAAAALPLTHGASLILPGSASYTCAAGDALLFTGEPSGVVRVRIWKADGTAVVAATSTPVVRQTVLKGPVDTAGLPTFLPATSGNLNLTSQNVSTGANALVATAAQGFGASGAVDVIGMSTSNLTWTGCTANNTNYLPVSISGGALTTVTPVILAPIYQWGGTPSVTANQYTFNIQQMTMYLGNGSTAPAVNHVIVGECIAGASTITSATAYALMGRYRGQSSSVPSNQIVSVNHNIGVTPIRFSVGMRCVTAEAGYVTGEEFSLDALLSASNANGAGPAAFRLAMQCMGDTVTLYTWHKTTKASTALTNGNWGTTFYAERGW